MNCVTSCCSVTVGFSGYVAAIECNNVQDERPSSSTSGGQFDGGATAIGVVVFVDFLADRKSVKELQVRQLGIMLALPISRLMI